MCTCNCVSMPANFSKERFKELVNDAYEGFSTYWHVLRLVGIAKEILKNGQADLAEELLEEAIIESDKIELYGCMNLLWQMTLDE